MIDSPPCPNTSSHRPYWLIALLLLLVLLQLGAIINTLQISSDTAEKLSLSPIVQIVAGSLWALIFARTAFSLWRRSPRAVNRVFYWILVFIVYSVLRLLSFAQSDYDRRRWPILVLCGGISLIVLIAYARCKKWQHRHN